MINTTFINSQVVGRDGLFTDEWRSIMSELFDSLNKQLSPEGLFVPIISNETMIKLNTEKSKSSIIYNKDDNEFYVCKNGTYKKVLTEA